MTLAEFRKRTATISDEDAEKCELCIMVENDPFFIPNISDITGDTSEIFLKSDSLTEYLDEYSSQ